MNRKARRSKARNSGVIARLLIAGLFTICFSGLSAAEAPAAPKNGEASPAKKAISADAASDLHGNPVDPLKEMRITVLVFLSAECPISNRYAPEIQRLSRQFEASGVKFWLIYPDADLSGAAIEKHLKEYRYSLNALWDPRHVLVRRAHARVTPEAAVFSREGRLVYHGRIDDRFVDFGKERSAATQRDLEGAIRAALENKKVTSDETRAVGCYISQ